MILTYNQKRFITAISQFKMPGVITSINQKQKLITLAPIISSQLLDLPYGVIALLEQKKDSAGRLSFQVNDSATLIGNSDRVLNIIPPKEIENYEELIQTLIFLPYYEYQFKNSINEMIKFGSYKRSFTLNYIVAPTENPIFHKANHGIYFLIKIDKLLQKISVVKLLFFKSDSEYEDFLDSSYNITAICEEKPIEIA